MPQWAIFTPVLEALRDVPPEVYAYGSRGPASADRLARRHGMSKFGGGLTPYVFLGDKLAAAEGLGGRGPERRNSKAHIHT